MWGRESGAEGQRGEETINGVRWGNVEMRQGLSRQERGSGRMSYQRAWKWMMREAEIAH